MRDRSNSSNGSGDRPSRAWSPPANEDESVGAMLRAAGRRPEIAADYLDEVRRTAGVVWRATVETYAARQRRRRAWYLAAATLAVGLGALVLYRSQVRPDAPPAGPAAVVEAAFGPVSVRAGDAIEAGEDVVTGPRGRVALRLAAGHGVRLDVGSRLEVESAAVLRLAEGAVYLDSARAEPGASIEVRTPYAVARDVGTQFEVRLVADALRVQVRAGRVDVEVAGVAHPAPAGTALTVHADGTVDSREIQGDDPGWTWTLETAPPFAVEGRSLAEYLDWLARETGWRIVFADPELEQEVAQARVHGTIAGLRPDQTPEVVFLSLGVDLEYRVRDGAMTIARTGR